MLQPARTKYRKSHRGNLKGVATRGTTVSFGAYGLKATERGLVTSRQIEAARQAMSRSVKRGGKIWVRIFPDLPWTKKGAEMPMGGGKGAPEFFCAKILPGVILFEMDGIDKAVANEAMKMAGHKLPIKTRVVERH